MAFANWWRERSQREHILLSVMIALLTITALWFGLWQPVLRWQQHSRDRLERATLLLSGVNQQAAWLRQQSPGKPQMGALSDSVAESAANAGFQISRTDMSQDGALSIQIASARAPALFAWIASLDQQQIFVDAIKLTTKSDATLAANITLKREPR